MSALVSGMGVSNLSVCSALSEVPCTDGLQLEVSCIKPRSRRMLLAFP